VAGRSRIGNHTRLPDRRYASARSSRHTAGDSVHPTELEERRCRSVRKCGMWSGSPEICGPGGHGGDVPQRSCGGVAGSGLLGLVLLVEAGGRGAGPVEFVDVMVELAAACDSTAMIYLMHAAAAVTASAAPAVGSPGLLAELASGRAVGTQAFSERRELSSRTHAGFPLAPRRQELNSRPAIGRPDPARRPDLAL